MTWGYNADVHAFRGDTSSDGIMQHAHTLVAQLEADRAVRMNVLLGRGTVPLKSPLSTWH